MKCTVLLMLTHIPPCRHHCGRNHYSMLSCNPAFLPLLIPIWIVSSLGLLHIKVLWTLICNSLCGYTLSFTLGKIPRNKTTGSHGRCMFTFLRHWQMVFQSDLIILFSNNHYMRIPVDSHPWYGQSNFSHSSGWAAVSNYGFNLHFSSECDAKHLFVCLFGICLSSLLKCLFNTFVHFLLGHFLLLRCKSV